jgi:hypothetical protein
MHKARRLFAVALNAVVVVHIAFHRVLVSSSYEINCLMKRTQSFEHKGPVVAQLG